MTDDAWRVEVTRPAARDIKRLDPPIQTRIDAALDGPHRNGDSGVGDWRVRFNRDRDTRTVLILRVLPRGRAYRED